MKSLIKTSHRFRSLVGVVIAALLLIGVSCEPEVVEWEPKSNQMVITEFVYSVPDNFSEFGEALVITGIENLLRVRGPFTLMLPDNEAMQEYYVSKGVSTISEMDVSELEDMVYNHVFQGEISVGSIGLGTLLYKNALGDFVASDLPGIDILLNKVAIITKRDIRVSNGYVHYIDHVMEPITDNVYDVLDADGGFEIFKQGLDLAGLSDTLKVIEFPFGNTTSRTRYTLLAVADTLFNREGINSIDDLVDRYDTGGELTDIDNGFFKFMEYHCLSGTHYFTDFEPDDIYYLVTADNYLNIKVEEDYKINKTDSTYTGFYYDQSNIPAKNGAIHTINSLLPFTDTDLSEVEFSVTHYFDLQQGPYYLKYYKRFFDGENSFEGIKWDGDFLLYYFKPGQNRKEDDAISLIGHFWVEFTLPKIRAGKYMMKGTGFGGSICSIHLDGEYVGVYDVNDSNWGDLEPVDWAEVEFQETEHHTVRLTTIVPGNIFLDFIVFTPR